MASVSSLLDGRPTTAPLDVTNSPVSSHETGSLTQSSPHESRFIGSSSGVYFINTVKQAFEVSRQQEEKSHLPAAEETVGGDDDFAPSARNTPERGQGFELNISSQRAIEVNSSAQLGSLPPYEVAQQLTIEYFKQWHPIVPFLSGSAFLLELEVLYHDPKTASGHGRLPADRRKLCNLIIFQCVLAVGASGASMSQQAPSSLPSRSNLLSLVASLASKHDILTIQTLLSAEVYCISTLALRTASTIGGLLSKLIYHAGLHRCPYRYPQLSNEDRDLRKRILWSAYALDRYLGFSLGMPVSLSDDEIDVCLSGRPEIHGTKLSDDTSVNSHPIATPYTPSIGGAGSLATSAMSGQPSSTPALEPNKLEVILANFVDYGKLAGRVMELFHMSLPSRNQDPRRVLFLRSDVDKWFNSMPEEPASPYNMDGADHQIVRFLPFLHVLYEQLKISIHRPALSLPRSLPEFHHALQVTIRAAKRTILAMERQSQLFWPGYVSSIWMSGLIISFACQIGLYNTWQGTHEILRCLDLLKRLGDRWKSAHRCSMALSTLLSELQNTERRASAEHTDDEGTMRSGKRRRTNGSAIDFARTAWSITPTSHPPTPPLGNMPDQKPSGGVNLTPSSLANNINEWDVNDFFHDISWENLFDVSEMTPDLNLQFLAR